MLQNISHVVLDRIQTLGNMLLILQNQKSYTATILGSLSRNTFSFWKTSVTVVGTIPLIGRIKRSFRDARTENNKTLLNQNMRVYPKVSGLAAWSEKCK
jgi:hypothetical protein